MIPILTLRCIAETGWCKSRPARFKAILGLGLATVFLAAEPAARASDPKAMRVGIETFAEPLSFETPGGEIAGFAVDLVRAVTREMKLEPQLVTGTWTDVFKRFQGGEIDVLASVAYSQERDAFIDFSVSHLTMRGAIFTRQGETRVRTPSDLANVRIAMTRDSFSQRYLLARGWGNHFVYVKDLHEALLALEAGRCDAITAVRIVGNHMLRAHGLKNIVASDLELPDYTFRLHLGVHAGDADRLALLNDGLARIRENGVYDQIHEKWIGPLEPRPLRWDYLRPVLLPVGLIGIIVAGTLWWQRRLLRRLEEQTQRLRESEGRLQRVLEGSEDGFWDWDIMTGRIERSERWASMLGYTLEEIGPNREGGAALVHPDDLSFYEAWQARLDSRSYDRCDVEYRMRTKSGEWRWILDRGKVVARTPDGKPSRMAGTHTDITTRKRTEAALLESQAMLKRSAQLLEQTQAAAHIGGWETDLRTGRVFWTPETYLLHETTPEAFSPTRDTVHAFFTPESRSHLLESVERVIRDGTSFSLDLQIVTRTQRPVDVHITGVAEREDGRVVKLYGSVRDITTERAAEREREDLRQKMLEAQKLESLGVLAGGIAHDFNNLLCVILANASFVRDTTLVEDARMEQIETAARRAADLCRQMLAYAGKGRFIVEPLDLGALVHDTAQLIRVSISKKAQLHLALQDGLPFVDADASQLRQVVMNLVINASEALGSEPGEIRISTRLGRPQPGEGGAAHSFDLPAGDCVCMEITDTGHGMTPATLARIFDPFFTTKFAGRGLGLAAVLGIVRTHHGALTVKTAPDQGSIFRLYLPVSRLASPTLAITVSTHPASPRPVAGTVLIADDEPDVLETTSALLRHRGFETVLAIDGNDAVRQFREAPHRFSAVLLDLTMPGLGGAEALRVIRSVNARVPALIMSGFSEQDVFDRVRGLGHVAVVRKPFTGAMLLARVAEVVPA